MRVIAGSARSLPLKTVKSRDVRPTTDRIKETLFNILSPYIPGCRFLDLFSGSGGIGIEALSRGASRAVFVEKDREALRIIRENLSFTRLSDRADVIADDAVRAVRGLNGSECFDVIFMDPPYNHLLEKDVIEALMDSTAAGQNTLIVVEASAETDFSYLHETGFEIVRDKPYGTNRHVFIKRVQQHVNA